jgi:hypothetical protein
MNFGPGEKFHNFEQEAVILGDLLYWGSYVMTYATLYQYTHVQCVGTHTK